MHDLSTGQGVAARPRGPLPVILTGTALVVVDFFLVNVILPVVRRDLGADDTAVTWMVVGYAITFAAGLVVGGRLGDRWGRRRILVIGLVAFAVTSAGCGLAPNAASLVGARLAQGVAAALLLPQVLAVVTSTYDGDERTRAFRAYALTVGLAGVAGQLVGGAIVELDPGGLGWRACFLVNVPVGLVAAALAHRLVPESRLARPAALDVVGAGLLTASLVAVVLPLSAGRDAGWPVWATVCLLAVPPLLGAQWLAARRAEARGGNPLVPPALLRRRTVIAGLPVVVAVYAGSASLFFVLALFLQDTLGLGPLAAGLMFCPFGTAFLASSLVAGWANRRWGRRSLAAGAALRACGLLGLAALAGTVAAGAPVAWLGVPLAVEGAGLGLIVGPLVATVLQGVPAPDAGAASGMLATAQQVGGALGVTVVGGVYLRTGGSTAAFAICVLALAALSILVVAGTQLLPRDIRRPVREAPAARAG